MTAPHVTFIVATYNRPDALLCTLRSVLAQTHQDWIALVIGDHCSEATTEAIRSVADPRIRYYNLPQRFGEQSGPNSFGLHFAPAADFLTFLNHDDLLLPDHIDYALTQLAEHGADFFIGRAANSTRLETTTDGRVRPVYTQLLPSSTNLHDLILEDPLLFDPSSFWLVRSAVAKEVGPWRPAGSLWRSPLRDWVMRAWRRGFRFCFGRKITGLRTSPPARRSVTYNTPSPDLEFMVGRITTEPLELLRAELAEEIHRNPASVPKRFQPHARLTALASPVLVPLYLRFGLDPANVWYWMLRRPKGGYIRAINQERIGAGLPVVQTISSEVLADPDSCRVI